MKIYEYLVLKDLPSKGIPTGETPSATLASRLNIWGSRGWEMCGITKAGWYIFKRERQPIVVDWWSRLKCRSVLFKWLFGSEIGTDHGAVHRFRCKCCGEVLNRDSFGNGYCSAPCEHKDKKEENVQQ